MVERLRTRTEPIVAPESIEGWKAIEIRECGELLVNVAEAVPQILINPQYFKQGIQGSRKEVFLRLGVVERLVAATQYLPKGYKFLIWDGWRPLEVQQALFDEFYNWLEKENPELPEENLMDLTQTYVSLPSINPTKPSPHNTGGAVDLTLAYEDAREVPMGTEFDDFSARAATAYFEGKVNLTKQERSFRNNRRILFYALIQAGFTNYREEWWHFDYGNQFWAVQNGTFAIYGRAIPPTDLRHELLIMRPLGPQGPKIGIGLSCRDDYVMFDRELGRLSEAERKTREGILQAVKNAYLPIVDF